MNTVWTGESSEMRMKKIKPTDHKTLKIRAGKSWISKVTAREMHRLRQNLIWQKLVGKIVGFYEGLMIWRPSNNYKNWLARFRSSGWMTESMKKLINVVSKIQPSLAAQPVATRKLHFRVNQSKIVLLISRWNTALPAPYWNITALFLLYDDDTVILFCIYTGRYFLWQCVTVTFKVVLPYCYDEIQRCGEKKKIFFFVFLVLYWISWN